MDKEELTRPEKDYSIPNTVEENERYFDSEDFKEWLRIA